MVVETSFDEYLYKKVENIQLVNINDICMSLSINWAYNECIPENIIIESQLSKIVIAVEEAYKVNFYLLDALKPVQSWIVDNICKAIQKKEIKPLVLRLFMDGKVDSASTYVEDAQIVAWLGYRGIQTEIYNHELEMIDDLHECFASIHKCIENNSYLLSDKINIRVVDGGKENIGEQHYSEISRTYKLESENRKLRTQLSKSKDVSLNKHAERYAVNREQVLGAALSVLANYPEQCRNATGKLEATKIRALVEEKALLFWPNTGEPPLSTEKIERSIREWLKKTGE